jgi:hypothetical protein
MTSALKNHQAINQDCARRFQPKYGNRVELRIIPNLHDGFVIVDGRRAWHVGHSLKDLGGRDSEMAETDLESSTELFEDWWHAAKPV